MPDVAQQPVPHLLARQWATADVPDHHRVGPHGGAVFEIARRGNLEAQPRGSQRAVRAGQGRSHAAMLADGRLAFKSVRPRIGAAPERACCHSARHCVRGPNTYITQQAFARAAALADPGVSCLFTQAFAQTAGATGGSADMIMQMAPFGAILVIMYFLLLRPQQRKAKAHQELIGNVRRGDTVVTTGGLIGKVTKAVGRDRDRARDRAEREGQARPADDFGGQGQGRAREGHAGQGLTGCVAMNLGRAVATRAEAALSRRIRIRTGRVRARSAFEAPRPSAEKTLRS